MSKIDGRFLTLNAGSVELANNLTTMTSGKALDAVQGKILNEKIEGITRIDCGEITVD